MRTGEDSALIVIASQVILEGKGRGPGLVGKKELLNVNSSLMPPGAEMPSLSGLLFAAGRTDVFGLLAGIFLFF